jgi:2,3-bisphosphoglycerate-independent phosphoglycerate mutase
VPDGAADEPIELLSNKTALEAAEKPNMDKISMMSRQGLVRTIPAGMEPGSDVAQMSLLGYNPLSFYTGRAPIEAAARNIELSDSDWVFRCNFITIADGNMADYSAGHISTTEAGKLIADLQKTLGNEWICFHAGISYRHLVVFKGRDFDIQTFPPHDYIGKPIEKILPRGKGSDILIDLMARSQQLFSNHDINQIRKDLGENQVSSIWLWGQGRRARMDSFQKRFGIKGASITAVDLVRGLSRLIGFDLIEVPGATGFVDTNYQGKGSAAVEALHKYDLVFIHIEAPDEASHEGDAQMKKKAIEQIDRYIVGPVFENLQNYKKWKILIAPDHPTPVRSCAHSPEPVPFVMAGNNISSILPMTFSEANAAKSGLKIDNGFELMEYFLKS